MGLASAMSTALTGLSAAETTIDVVGNNLANSNTVGFKASEASFATQFLQTLALGAAPTENTGGTNPRQVGLGTMVADITPDFSQGTIEISSNPTDMAIQGDGFFIVQGGGGEHLYTRNGIFKMNSENQLVTITGNRVLGFGIDDDFQIQRTVLTPLTIPLGATAVAQPTANAWLEGTLSPTGDVADQGEIIQTNILGQGDHIYPTTALERDLAQGPNLTTALTALEEQDVGTGGMQPGQTFEYRFVYVQDDPDETGTEETNWSSLLITTEFTDSQVEIQNIPHAPDPIDGEPAPYDRVRIYRRDASETRFRQIRELPLGGAGPWDFIDDKAAGFYAADPVTYPAMDEGVLNGEFTYYVTFGRMTDPSSVADPEYNSRPSELSLPRAASNSRLLLRDLPTTTTTNADGWNSRRIWRRNNSSDDPQWHLVEEIPNVDQDVIVIDEMTDEVAFDQPVLDLDGPRIRPDTHLVDVVRRDGSSYENVFEEGVLEFTGRKGGRSLAMKEFTITEDSTVQDLMNFLEQALGIQRATGIDADQDIPPDAATNKQPGGFIEDGRINLLGNNGVDNALDIGLSGMLLRTESGEVLNVDLPWASVQDAVGESAVTDFLVYDSLGIPLRVRLTAALESRNSTSTTYRWFADSPDNDPLTGVGIAVGTGLITFDGEGNFVSATESTVSIERRHVSSASPLEFELDFTQISGLAANQSTLAVSRQDGSAPGVLTSFIVGEDGTISGVFSNGVTRDLGQLRLARFANAAGLEQRGQNLFAEGVNSGLPVHGDPGQQGIGTIIAGATELSNTDIGSNLIDLILASTMYRGNTRVITTAQQMLDELLALRR
ncbi:MAG: flagellar hook-basal body complex protein [Pirellulales bacterium]|nr:flagellar hook-basal body complex protein [Pirellulales bacterium]